MNIDSYQLFSPPSSLAVKSHKQWTADEANLYLNWLLDTAECRIERFLELLSISRESSAVVLFRDVGSKLEVMLKSDWCRTETDEIKLSSIGYSLAADAGLLIAERLIDAGNRTIKWQVLRKPRSAQSFNLPVLVGFASGVELDPIAASIAQGAGALKGVRKEDRWLRLYSYWLDLIG